MQRSRFDGHVASIKAKFDELDKSKDGALQFEEVKEFLRERRPDAKDRDLKWWFQEYDKVKKGRMSFKDFSDMAHKEEFTGGLVAEREEAGKLVVTRESSEARSTLTDEVPEERESTAAESAGLDWEVVQNVFAFYAGSDKVLQGNEFARLCRDCELYDDEYFTPGHAEMVFSKFCHKDSTIMKKQGFRKALISIATMKGVPISYFRLSLKQRTEHIEEQVRNQQLRRDSFQSKKRRSTVSSISGLPPRPSVSSTTSTRPSITSATSEERSGPSNSSAASVASSPIHSPTNSSERSSSLSGSIAVALRKAKEDSPGKSERRPSPLIRTNSTPALRRSGSLSRINSKSEGKLATSKSLKAAGGRVLALASITAAAKAKGA
mmetsp:Transcript_22981/g.42726  ORF Transcript_22981/g.42726 Transcript_22981/m.42726 type:complete len:379 (-) Transcript_22981:160-1296(-)